MACQLLHATEHCPTLLSAAPLHPPPADFIGVSPIYALTSAPFVLSLNAFPGQWVQEELAQVWTELVMSPLEVPSPQSCCSSSSNSLILTRCTYPYKMHFLAGEPLPPPPPPDTGLGSWADPVVVPEGATKLPFLSDEITVSGN